jgi:acetoin utilization deacetylase AcuC-like enzyme
MKIIYSSEFDLIFSNYGIEIPIVDDRAKKVFETLKKSNPEMEIFPSSLIPKIVQADLLLAHKKDYVDDLFKSSRSLEYQFMTAYELIDEKGAFHRYNPENAKFDFHHAFKNVLAQVGLTYFSMKLALNEKFVYFLGGGMHHAMSFGGRGFCLVNDLIIATRKLQNEKLVKTVWIIDVDVHKGDGTAEISKLDASIVTMSIHMKEGWPLNSGSVRDPWFIPSNIDVGIDAGEERSYLEKLNQGLEKLKNNFPLPDLAVVVNGADPYELDELPSSELLKLSKEQMLERDKLVYQFLKELNIPQAYVMAGGYGKHSHEIYSQFLEFVGKSSSDRSKISSWGIIN